MERLASASTDRTIRIRNPADGREVLALRGHERGLVALDWSPDGTRIASPGAGMSVLIWDATAGYSHERSPRALPPRVRDRRGTAGAADVGQ